jgi:hypothetical protein
MSKRNFAGGTTFSKGAPYSLGNFFDIIAQRVVEMLGLHTATYSPHTSLAVALIGQFLLPSYKFNTQPYYADRP